MNLSIFFVPLVPIIWAFPVFILLLYLTLGSDWIKHRAWRGSLEPVDWLVLIYVVLCCLSFLKADFSFHSLYNYLRSLFGTYLFPVLAYFALRLIRFTDQRVSALRKAALAAGVVFSLACLFEFIFSHPLVPEFDNRDQWVGGEVFRAGSLAMGSVSAGELAADFIALTIPFLFFRYPGRHRFRLLQLLALEVLGLAVVLSRAGYVAAFTCVLVASLYLRGRRQGKFLVIGGGLLLLMIVAPHLPTPDWLMERMTSEGSTIARIPRFVAGILFIQDNFRVGWSTALFGRGFMASYMMGGDYYEGHSISLGDELLSSSFLSGGFHNGYLTLLGDQGLLAFICYLVVVIAALRRLWYYCRPLRQLERPILKNPAALEPMGWGLVIIAHLVTDTVHWATAFPQMFYFFVGLAMVFNLTSPVRVGQPVREINRYKPVRLPGSIPVSRGLAGEEPPAVPRLGASVPLKSAIDPPEGKPE